MASKLNTEIFIERAKAVHGDRYDYSVSEYAGSGKKIKIVCKFHGEFNQVATVHLKGHGCPKCYYESVSKNLAIDTETFIMNAKAMHGDRYDYSKVNYIRSFVKVEIICKIHGSFWQLPSNHATPNKAKAGCPKCAGKGMDTEDFIKKSTEIHGGFYKYDQAEYTLIKNKVMITCPTHGEFAQNAEDHLLGKCCRKCRNEQNAESQRYSTDEFIEKAKLVHGERYEYRDSVYTKSVEKINITCKKHGNFTQIAAKHLSGQGCQQCWIESFTSKGEREVADWIESLGFETERNNRRALSPGMEIDIYIPPIKTGIEYNGCFWHSDRIEGDKRATEQKHRHAEAAGIRLITVWDFDWLKRRGVVKRHLLHALGIDPSPRIHARACATEEIGGSDANAFYSDHHIQGACRGAILNFGLKRDRELVAAMSFTRGGTRRGKTGEGEWELARYATSAIVRGGASKLFNAFIKTARPETVWSFSDNQHFGGGLYGTLGFREDGRLPADYRVIDPKTMKVWHKSQWQRKNIPNRLREMGSAERFTPDGDPRTERQMQDLTGALRVWDAGKTRWIWTRP